MKIPRFFRQNKLWAATARRSSAASAGMDFEEMPEPNMKLSRALLIVLLLHVVAVSGIIAFNAIKTRENSFVPAALADAEPKPSATAAAPTHVEATKAHLTEARKEDATGEDTKPSHSILKISSKDEHENPSSVANQTSSRRRETSANRQAAPTKLVSSGKTYVVKKGDNPVTIAKKLKVSYDDLIALNHIEDPRKLRIGQKLLIPNATTPKTTKGKAANSKEKKKKEVRHAKQQSHST
ncbi:MAG TPA: LysM peptidoglycan-binding domain-containing protein [Candidatus Udaeobacter sp.]|nr:LysM peptidoglycan-binding domain-containing protein [Candidatus Udaeobacter sp.]